MSLFRTFGLTYFACLFTISALAQDGPKLKYQLEFKTNYRDSKQAKFKIPFPFPASFLPPGETSASLETVDAGEHFEISRVSLYLEGALNKHLYGRMKIDAIDKYDRNPTSSDNRADIDEAWLRYGHEVLPEELPRASGIYIKAGKFAKFERQDDRNLESYGLVSTRFNRFEDAGIEVGVDIGRFFYIKGSYTTGNPLFMRDPNALAGDNGTNDRNPNISPNPNPDLKSGFVFFYDSEIEDLEFGSNAESGLALGVRIGNDYGSKVANLMFFGYNRSLRSQVDLTGTFYGGDLDLLRGLEEMGLIGGLPLQGRDKKEWGANLWLYLEDFTLFAQYVDSEVAGLNTSGLELELAWTYAPPWTLALGGKAILTAITPSIRFSRLEPDFTGNPRVFPTPSVWWKWEKIDAGINIRIYSDLLFTAEYASNSFFRLGKWEHADEFLATLSWRWSSEDRKEP